MTSYLLDNRHAEAARRFAGLSDLFDPVTFRHLDVIGVGPGWRCWEVGAGGPSVPAWLADKAGASVVATDIDVRWLPADAGFEVVLHDVVNDPPPGEAFDLIHARLVLTHLPERAQALEAMVGALRPGGWLVIEDFDVDMQPCATPDARTPEHYLANRIRAGLITLLAERGVDLELGRRLPRLFRELGLVDVTADAHLALAIPAASALERANLQQVRQGLMGLRVASDGEIDRYLGLLEAGEIDVASPPLVSACGRRPST